MALSIGKEYADLPPIAYAKVKQQVRAPVIMALQKQINEAAHSKPEAWFTAETPEAMAKMIG